MKSFNIALILAAAAMTGCMVAKDTPNQFVHGTFELPTKVVDLDGEAIHLFKESNTISEFITKLSARPELHAYLAVAQKIKQLPTLAFKLEHEFPKLAKAIKDRFPRSNVSAALAAVKFVKS